VLNRIRPALLNHALKNVVGECVSV
jgi:hypothetical protein